MAGNLRSNITLIFGTERELSRSGACGPMKPAPPATRPLTVDVAAA